MLLTNGKEPLSPKAVALLKKVKAALTEEPRRFVMARWGVKVKPSELLNLYNKKTFAAPLCGTVACIGGWTVLLGTPRKELGFDPFKTKFTASEHRKFRNRMVKASESAAKLLGLVDGEEDQLFSTTFWPSPFISEYHAASTPRQRVGVAKRRIDHFIKYRE